MDAQVIRLVLLYNCIWRVHVTELSHIICSDPWPVAFDECLIPPGLQVIRLAPRPGGCGSSRGPPVERFSGRMVSAPNPGLSLSTDAYIASLLSLPCYVKFLNSYLLWTWDLYQSYVDALSTERMGRPSCAGAYLESQPLGGPTRRSLSWRQPRCTARLISRGRRGPTDHRISNSSQSPSDVQNLRNGLRKKKLIATKPSDTLSINASNTGFDIF